MQTEELVAGGPLNLRAGDQVEVRSEEEILATLDDKGELDCLPFMPEMVKYCGQRLTVASVAHKLCDTMTRSGMRRMQDAVHLTGVRCDGQAHGGCQAACLTYWKTAWLKPVAAANGREPAQPVLAEPSRLLPLVVATSRRTPDANGDEVYRCQATELLRAAPEVVRLRDMDQYVQDVRSGNVGVAWMVRGFLVGLFNWLQSHSKRVLPRWLLFRGGLAWGFLKGSDGPTPTLRTDLQPGELVRIKSKDEIMRTLNRDLLNRGMGFDPEMARFCGRTARVARRIDRIIEEKTGKMRRMQSPCIVLEGIVCEGAFNASCPRAITPYWREVWLERVEAPV